DTPHPDLQVFTLHNGNTASRHGTATAGIVAATGAGSANARGVVPGAHLVVADYDQLSISRYSHSAQLQNTSLPYQCVVQSNSWGNTRTLSYTSISQDMDAILFDHDRLTITQSQSNSGTQDSRPQAWAKNVISVGGINHQNTATKTDDSWNGGASIGPAADGRIKPDIASFYDATYTIDQPGSAGYASGSYTNFGGTSGATPIVSGHVVMLYQMWSDGVFGNATNAGQSVF
ncbi:unnamed protein product, partial [Laminaria digitata]